MNRGKPAGATGRHITRKYGIEYAKELARHTSDRYFWRYVQPSNEEKQRAVEDEF